MRLSWLTTAKLFVIGWFASACLSNPESLQTPRIIEVTGATSAPESGDCHYIFHAKSSNGRPVNVGAIFDDGFFPTQWWEGDPTFSSLVRPAGLDGSCPEVRAVTALVSAGSELHSSRYTCQESNQRQPTKQRCVRDEPRSEVRQSFTNEASRRLIPVKARAWY